MSFRYGISSDTLFAEIVNDKTIENDICLLISNNFHKRFGILISDYYIIG
jgi:hypothetical protein